MIETALHPLLRRHGLSQIAYSFLGSSSRRTQGHRQRSKAFRYGRYPTALLPDGIAQLWKHDLSERNVCSDGSQDCCSAASPCRPRSSGKRSVGGTEAASERSVISSWDCRSTRGKRCLPFLMATAYWLSQSIYVAAKLGIADLLEHGPQPYASLAAATASDASSLFRLMRALSSVGVASRPGLLCS
jgi:hypothetical protein